ncbi:hypothetical protein CONLIGDRAFT_498194 [Coniochaeta ligniaria NRRL 30616]|uniref:Uncharacterized protein n=1 Tax=Coniochaeta ligniaria NRRL 30616 TaxID=1408157 RepID=A0A1J7IDR8_9PEZI|nr:hypothetical protein CONLIGDRAFT_498194 [Coniochaeta ligniaria NRRL 30616]
MYTHTIDHMQHHYLHPVFPTFLLVFKLQDTSRDQVTISRTSFAARARCALLAPCNGLPAICCPPKLRAYGETCCRRCVRETSGLEMYFARCRVRLVQSPVTEPLYSVARGCQCHRSMKGRTTLMFAVQKWRLSNDILMSAMMPALHLPGFISAWRGPNAYLSPSYRVVKDERVLRVTSADVFERF